LQFLFSEKAINTSTIFLVKTTANSLKVFLVSFTKAKRLFAAKNSYFLLTSLLLSQHHVASAQVAVNALPTGGQVVAGQVAISQTQTPTSATMNVNQTSQRAIVNWDSFNVGKNAQVNFNQPNAQAAILNRVTGASASVIDGAVRANGQVVLVNPNGVTFGKGADINAGAVVATTLNIANKDFMEGKSTFHGNGKGAVINQGKIAVNDPNGYIALLAPEVRNEGYLLAQKGPNNGVVLAAGEQIALDFRGDKLISVNVDKATYGALIENKRVIEVSGGLIVVAAGAANQIMGSVIKNTGRISANSMVNNGGVIELVAANVTQAGSVSANSTAVASQTSGKGGQVHIAGENITLAANSTTTATGTAGGGSVEIGLGRTVATNTKSSAVQAVGAAAANLNTNGSIDARQAAAKQTAVVANQQNQLAKNVTVEANALVDASATQQGNAGNIVIWSEIKTSINGMLKAIGGMLGGNGGFIETSSKGAVAVGNQFNVNTSAPKGNTGLWLLDPIDLVIDAGAASVISTALQNNNVTIEVNGNVCPSLGSCTQNGSGSLTIASGADILKSGTNLTTLTLSASGIFNLNANISGENLNVIINSSIAFLNVGTSISASTVTVQAQTIHARGTIQTHRYLGSANPGSLGNAIELLAQALYVSGRLSVNAVSKRAGAITLNANSITLYSGATLEATGEDGGMITLAANDSLWSQGDIQANGSNGRGGTLTITAANDLYFDQAVLKANGTTDGGAITIIGYGGDLHIKNSLIQTNGSNGRGGSISASASNAVSTINSQFEATGYSHGGQILIGNDAKNGTLPFALRADFDEGTSFNSAQLDPNPDNQQGGFIETSGQILNMLSSINAGRGGMWLLDPWDYVIGSSEATKIQNVLRSSNVIIQTSAPSALSSSNKIVSTVDSRSGSDSITINSDISSASTKSLTFIGSNIRLNANITTGGSQTYDGDVTLGKDVALKGSTINFEDDLKGAFSLTITGNAIFGSSRFDEISLTGFGKFISVSGNSRINTDITTSGNQTYTGAVTLGNDVTLATLNNGSVAMNANVNGAKTLTINTNGTGDITITGALGNSDPLTGLTINTDVLNAAALTLVSNGAISITNSGASTISGIIAGSGVRLSKAGVGTLTLANANTYSGVTTINAGTLSISAASGLGATPTSTTSNSIQLNGGTLRITDTFLFSSRRGIQIGGEGGTIEVDSGETFNYDGIIRNATGVTGNLTKTGLGTLILSGDNTYSGVTTINAGTLSISAASGLGATPTSTTSNSIQLNGGTLRITDTFLFSSRRGMQIGGEGGTIEVDLGETFNYDGIIRNATGVAGNLTKTGSGTLTLSGDNTYSGATRINGGSLNITGTLADSTAVTVASGATYIVAANDTITSIEGSGNIALSENLTLRSSEDTAFGGVLSGTGSLTKSGAGILTLSGNNTYSGGTRINEGTLKIERNTATFFGSIISGPLGKATITINDGASLDLNGKDISNNLVIAGDGVGSAGSIFNSSGIRGSISGSVLLSAHSSIGAGDIQISGEIDDGSRGTYHLTKSNGGVLTLSGENEYDGFTIINGGILSIRTASGLGETPNRTISNSIQLNGGTLRITDTFLFSSRRGIEIGTGGGTIEVDARETFNYYGIISGEGFLTKLGTGTLALFDNNTYSGGTTISAGTINVGNNSALGTGNVTLSSGTTLQASASVTITNAVSLSGAATINAPNSHSLTISGVLNDGGHGLVVAGSGNLTFSNGSNSISALASSGTIGTVSINNNQSLVIGSVTPNSTPYTGLAGTGSITLINTGATTINSGAAISTTGGDINIVTSRFTNNAGSGALSASGTNKYWRVWSTNTDPFGNSVGDIKGNLAPNFIQYAASYGTTTVSGTGNGFLYTLAPTITVSLNGTVSKVYDATEVATLASENYSYSGNVNGDAVTFSIAATYDTKDVGTAKLVSATVSGLQATNSSIPVYGYALSTASISDNIGVITARPIFIAANANQSKVYGESDPTLAYTVQAKATGSGLLGTDGVTVTGSLTRAAGENVGSTYAIGRNTVEASGANSGNYSISYTGANFAITARPITLTASAATKVYGESDPSLAVTVTGGSLASVAFTDTLANVTGTVSRSVGENVGNYNILLGSGSKASNYTITFDSSNQAMGITARPIFIAANANQSKVYGESDPTLAYTVQAKATGSGLLGTDGVTVTGSLTRAAGENVGSTYAIGRNTVEASGANSGNYSISYTGANFAITARPITLTASAATKVYGESDPSLAVTVTGGSLASVAFTDTLANVTGTVSRSVGENVGNYNILLGSGSKASNYTITFDSSNQAMGITARPIFIAANANQSKVYGESDPTLAYTVQAKATGSGLLGTDGVTVTGSLTRAAGENVGSTYAIGRNTVEASGANSGNYSISYTGANFAITARPITLTASAATKVYGESDPSLAVTVTGGSLASVAFTDTLANVTGTVSRSVGENVGNYNILLGSGSKASNYTITFDSSNQAMGITARPIFIAANANQSKVYGDVNPVYTYTAEAQGAGRGLVVGDSLIGDLARVSGENVGRYAITRGTLANANYAITLVSTDFVINKAVLTLTPSIGQSKNYGRSDPIYGYSLSGYINNDVVQDTSANTAITGLLARAPGESIGSYAYNATGLSASNYRIQVTESPSTFTILPAPIGVAISGTYSGTNIISPSSFTVTGLAFGETIASISSAVVNSVNVADNGSNYVTSVIGVSGSASMSNYYITSRYNGVPNTDTSNTATITPARLRVAAANDAKFVTQSDATASAANCDGPCAGGFMGMTFNGFVNGQTPAVLSGSPLITRTNPSANSAGIYSGVLQPSGYSSSNYSIDYVAGDYVIAPANSLLVRVNPVLTSYGSNPVYRATAAYLANDGTTIVNLTPSISGSAVTVADGVGGSAQFTLTMAGSTQSTSGNTNVGGYNLVATAPTIIAANFNNLMVVGSATVQPFILSPSQLGVTGVTKVYDGNVNIGGLVFNADPTLSAVLGSGATKDNVTILGSGIFTENANVGSAKNVSVALSLAGIDGGNYVLSTNDYMAPIGTITQLASVNYIGPAGGNWSTQTNWAGGAIPTLNNVANVFIPAGSSVVYDFSRVNAIGSMGSTIINNGTVTINEALDTRITNTLSGGGSFAHTGSGALTIAGNNNQSTPGPFTGQISVASGKTLLLANANALGGGSVLSNNGLLALDSDTTLSSLAVNGPVTLVTNIRTLGNQRYDGAVTFASGLAGSPMQISSTSGDIQFLSTLNSDAANRSLTLSSAAGKISFSDTVGYLAPGFGPKGPSIYDLVVNAKDILLMADMYTLSTQTYNGAVVISNNGSNGLLRTFISQDPSIAFLGTVDDSSAVTHTLDVRAISYDPLLIPEIRFMGAVGSIVPLGGLLVTTEMRTIPADPMAPITIVPAGSLTIADNINTVGEQRFSSAAVTLEPAPGRTITFNSERSTVQFAGIPTQDLTRLSSQANIVNNSNPIVIPVNPQPDTSNPASSQSDSLLVALNTPFLKQDGEVFSLSKSTTTARVSVTKPEQAIPCKIEANDECVLD
jgi:filamentous hemagglutinin family protein